MTVFSSPQQWSVQHWDDISQVGSEEYQIRAKDLHQNLTRTWHWQLKQQQSESCQNQIQALVSFITKVFVRKSSRTIFENPLDLLIKGALGGDSQPMLTPSTINIPWLHLAPPLCLTPCLTLQLLWQYPLMSLQPTFKTLAITHSVTARAGSHYPLSI